MGDVLYIPMARAVLHDIFSTPSLYPSLFISLYIYLPLYRLSLSLSIYLPLFLTLSITLSLILFLSLYLSISQSLSITLYSTLFLSLSLYLRRESCSLLWTAVKFIYNLDWWKFVELALSRESRITMILVKNQRSRLAPHRHTTFL